MGNIKAVVGLFLMATAVGAVIGVVVGRGSGGGATPPAASAPAPEGAAPESPAADNPYAGFRLAEFRLQDQDGAWVNERLLDGQVTVLTFFFTSCRGPCPDMARAMKQVQDRTRGTALRLASISVDGARDTPAIIASFAESYGADPSRWWFLTGDPEQVRVLARESIGFELREQEDNRVAAPDGSLMNNILHPTRLLLVGPDRRLIGVYWYNDPAQIDQLVADARKALG